MKKRTLAIVIALVLVIGAVAGGTIAWLTSTTEQVKNTFTVGKVEIVLDEAEVKYDEKTQATVKTESTYRVIANDYEYVMPGDNLPKDPTITVLEGSAESYVRAILTVKLTDKGAKAAAEAAKVEGETKIILDVLADMAQNLGNYLVDFDKSIWTPYEVGKYTTLTIDADLAKSMAKDLMDGKGVSVELWYKDGAKVPGVATDAGKDGQYVTKKADGTVDQTVDYKGTALDPIFTAIKVPGELDEYTMPIFDGMEISIIGNAIQTKNLDTAADAWKAFDGVSEEAPATGGETTQP